MVPMHSYWKASDGCRTSIINRAAFQRDGINCPTDMHVYRIEHIDTELGIRHRSRAIHGSNRTGRDKKVVRGFCRSCVAAGLIRPRHRAVAGVVPPATGPIAKPAAVPL